MAKNSRQTSSAAATRASQVLRSARATPTEKPAAASTLAQTGTRDQTGARAASAAGRTLADPTATRAERSAAASALSQTPTPTRKK